MKVLALDVGGTAIKSAMVGAAGEISLLRTMPTNGSAPDNLIQKAIEAAKGYEDYELLAVAMTGQIDHHSQTMLARSNGERLEAVEEPIGRILEEGVGRPVYVINDSNAAALGEAHFGAGRGYRDFLCLTYGTGVGGGIIQNGSLMAGARGIAGEVGHMVTHRGGRRCRCGLQGCYQEYASVTALMREAKKRYPQLKNAKELMAALPERPDLEQVLEGWIEEVTEGICSLTHIFNPPCFILGGGIMECGDILEKIRAAYGRRIIPSYRETKILQAALGNRAGLLGVAFYAREEKKNG